MRLSKLQGLLLSAVFADVVNAALYVDPKELPSDTFDFVIVGGELRVHHFCVKPDLTTDLSAGAAGNVLAHRLTENPKFSVLVIEAGIS